jgi:hypothetical protein
LSLSKDVNQVGLAQSDESSENIEPTRCQRHRVCQGVEQLLGPEGSLWEITRKTKGHDNRGTGKSTLSITRRLLEVNPSLIDAPDETKTMDNLISTR